MHYSSSLADSQKPFVLDTSVLINLHACTYGKRILSAIPNNIIVPQIVAGELDHETSRKNGGHSFLNNLVFSGKVTLLNMTDNEYNFFHRLTAGPSSIDDGEAATIAVSVNQNLLPVIDEKRGRSRASDLMRPIIPAWSLDLFCHPLVMDALGEKVSIEALYLALRHGKMRIPPESAERVITFIGEERAADCICLPGYRERFSTKKLTTSM